MRIVSSVMVLVLSLAIAGSLAAAEKKKGEGKKGGEQPLMALAMLRNLNLTPEQKTKVDELEKQYRPKLAEPMKKMQAIFTDEQRKARKEAEEKAKAAGKSPQEARAAGEAAMNLSAEQKTKLAEVQKEMAPMNAELREKAMALLTPEQKEQLQKAGGKAGKGGKKAK
jgi:Spy/CpxP family protein refolding chaperone